MSAVVKLHNQAMSYVDDAIAAKRRNEEGAARAFTRLAFESERSAALLLKNRQGAEPTRSVLLRSAAALALDCGENREAERMIALALSGEPPHEIAEELRDLLEQVQFDRHLNVRGVELSEDEFQVAIFGGESVSFDFAESDVFFRRVHAADKAIYRTIERKSGATYKDHSNQNIRSKFATGVSSLRPGSIALSIKIVSAQLRLFAELTPAALIGELFDCLELFNAEDETGLRKAIDNDLYFQNFIGLARQLCPDGRNVKLVGLTAILGGRERRLKLDRSRNSISINRRVSSDDTDTLLRASAPAERVSVTGRLRFASNRQSKGRIQLVDESKFSHTIVVPRGLMNDIVRPMWDSIVTVTGTKVGKVIHLDTIDQTR